ncbi:MAG TPA: acyltransferase family protein [Planctomycetaceae bacterium]|nr:acyltransferase family protein [Planctomycetaceae bacterium]
MHAGRVDYRRDIDGLRAIAVVSVVLCHAGLGLSGGYIGVDVFFVISGYLITSLIVKELEQGTFSLAGFWERRIRRILPALVVVTIATIAAGWLLLMPDAYASLGKSVVALAMLTSNMLFCRETGYFQSQAEEKPLLHTWSLAVEEQFYLLVPVFFLLFARRKSLHRAFLLLVVASIASFGLSIYGARYSAAAFFLLPTRAWELLAGALLARLPVRWQTATPRVRDLAAVIGLSLIAIPCFLYDNETRFPGLAALPPVLGAALLIWSGNTAVGIPRASRLLACRPIVFIGLISYSLYLWHWPLFAFANYQSVKPLANTERWFLVAISFILAMLSWRYVERPFRSRRLLESRRRLLAVTALAFLVVLGSGAAMCLDVFPARRWPSSALPRIFADTGRRDARYLKEHDPCDVPGNLARIGDAEAPAEILVWGDSHAMSVLPAIESACAEAKSSAQAATHSSRAPALGYVFPSRYQPDEQEDACFNAAVMEYVRSGPIRAVVLVGYWQHYGEKDGAKLADAILNTVDGLLAAGVSVYFMMDVPAFSFEVPRTLVRYSQNELDLSQLGMTATDYAAMNRFQTSILPKLRERGVHILDPLPILQARTKSSTILPFDSGGSFYSDKNHLSTYGALALKPLFVPVVLATASRHAKAAQPSTSVN